MGTSEYTKINFSLYELLSMIGRIEVQNNIMYSKLSSHPIPFPNKRMNKSKIFTLPSDHEIEATIRRAKVEAMKCAQKLGMESFDNIDNYHISSSIVIDEDETVETSQKMHQIIYMIFLHVYLSAVIVMMKAKGKQPTLLSLMKMG